MIQAVFAVYGVFFLLIRISYKGAVTPYMMFSTPFFNFFLFEGVYSCGRVGSNGAIGHGHMMSRAMNSATIFHEKFEFFEIS